MATAPLVAQGPSAERRPAPSLEPKGERLVVGIVCNPIREKKVARFEQLLASMLAGTPIEVRRYTTRAPDDAAEQTRRAIADGVDVLVPGGGDGTLLGVVNGVGDGDVPVLVAPLGGSNDFAKALGHDTIEAAVRALAVGALQRVDLGVCRATTPAGEARELRFSSSSGAGFVADIVTLERRPWIARARAWVGDAIYPFLVSWLIATTQRQAMTVTVDGRPIRGRCTLLEVGKVKATGGFPITPTARPGSGHFDVCLAPDRGRWRNFAMLFTLARKKHVGHAEVQYFSDSPTHNAHGLTKVRKVSVESDTSIPIHLHGEPVGLTPASFELLPEALTIVVRSTHGD